MKTYINSYDYNTRTLFDTKNPNSFAKLRDDVGEKL